MRHPVARYWSHLRPLWSTRKFINAARVLASYALSRLTGSYIVWGLPYSFVIEPSALCNLQCPQCPVGLDTLDRPQSNMPLHIYRHILDDIGDHAWQMLLFFQGEPFINPHIEEMINEAYDRRIFTVISTNGTKLANDGFAERIGRSNLSRLIVSLDGASEETYQVYRRGGSFDTVVQAIRNVVRERDNAGKAFPIIDLQFIVMRHNEHEIPAIRRLGKELGVDRVLLKSAQIYDLDNAEATLPKDEKYRRYVRKSGSYVLKGSYSGYCMKIWIGSVITWEGTVLPCCFDKRAEHPLGQINGQGFKEAWDGKAYHAFRKGVVRNRSGSEMCRNCTEGLRIFWPSSARSSD